MYREFTINNFRGFRDLHLQNLQRVNLITGKNNVGKTALFEALAIHLGTYNPSLILNVSNFFRGIGGFRPELGQRIESPWNSLFRDFDTSEELVLRGVFDEEENRVTRIREIKEPEQLSRISQEIPNNNGELIGVSSSLESTRVLKITYEDNGTPREYYLTVSSQSTEVRPLPLAAPMAGIFLPARGRFRRDEEAERFSSIRRDGSMSIVLDVLQAVDARISDVTLLYLNGEPVFHVELDGFSKLMPLPYMGDGLSRLMSFILAIGNATDGVVIIDEIENGLHYSVLENVWKGIAKAARQFNTQIFATTHSRECTIAAHRAFTQNKPYDLGLYRLERNKAGEIHAVSYTEDTLEAAIDMDLEVR